MSRIVIVILIDKPIELIFILGECILLRMFLAITIVYMHNITPSTLVILKNY
jgi:hypothetical protein